MTRALIVTLAAATALAPTLASAQAAAPAAGAQSFGPPIQGMCFFSRDGAIGGSKAGQAMVSRLRQLSGQVEAELNPQRQSLQTENTAVNALPAAQREPRENALQQRAQTFSQTVQLRQAQVQLTQARAVSQITTQLNPILQSLAGTHRCAVVFDGGSTYGYNGAMDLTREAVAQLDTRMPTISFDLATPDQVRQAAAQQQQR